MPAIRNRKNRPPAGTGAPVNTKAKDTTGEAFGCIDPSIAARLDQDIALYRKGYQDGLREGLALGPNHPAVIESVKRMFPHWDGQKTAQCRSIQRFHNEQGGEAA